MFSHACKLEPMLKKQYFIFLSNIHAIKKCEIYNGTRHFYQQTVMDLIFHARRLRLCCDNILQKILPDNLILIRLSFFSIRPTVDNNKQNKIIIQFQLLNSASLIFIFGIRSKNSLKAFYLFQINFFFQNLNSKRMLFMLRKQQQQVYG